MFYKVSGNLHISEAIRCAAIQTHKKTPDFPAAFIDRTLSQMLPDCQRRYRMY
jgi:hypothetical protein